MAEKSPPAPEINISGLDGAEHWVWVEGEDFVEGRGGRAFRQGTNISGHSQSKQPNVYMRNTGRFDVGTAHWNIPIAAPLSNKAKLYLRASINVPAAEIVLKNGPEHLSESHPKVVSSGTNTPENFLEWRKDGTDIGQGLSTGPLTPKTHQFSIQAEPYETQNFSNFQVDGILIYDGSPNLRGTQKDFDGIWRLKNPSSSNPPVLAKRPNVKVDISGLGSNHEAATHLNGEPYNTDVPIESPGVYELAISIYELCENGRRRVAFTGANFKIE